MAAGKPEYHLVAHEQAELLLEFEFRLRQAPRDCHNGAAEDAFRGEWAHECLQIGSESEWDRLWVVKEGFPCSHA